VNSDEFKTRFRKVFENDQQQFDEPPGWSERKLQESPLIKDFYFLWEKIKTIYTNELSILAYTEIPNEKDVAKALKELMSVLAGIENNVIGK